ncbi:restriction endonuclease subunit S [Enterococcus casseliflavus]|uniref:restriction endonuclease subunit S n=1 Tax=Enterococcus casseliflavus TaxID=37734 RepID=UPI0039A70209
MSNETRPEIRFPGFTEDWEQRKVFEISKVTYGGGTPKTNTKEFWNGNIPWIQSSDLEINRLFNVSPKKKITNEAVKKSAAKIIPPNSIAIVTRVGVGKLALMPFEYATSQDFLSLSELQIDSYFGIFSLYSMLQKELKNIQGTSIKGMTKSDLLEKKVTIPKKCEEQQKIGTFFKQLDDTITLHQRKLDLLKETKKGFLQKMFPKNGAKVPEIRFPGFTEDWEERKLGELTKIKTGSSDLQDADAKGIYPFFVRSEIIERSNRYIFDGEAILIPGEGRLGEIYHYINGKFDFHQRVYKISDFQYSDTDGKYILYYMQKYFKKHAMKYTVKATVDSLRLPMLTEFDIKIPSLDEQRAISSFFSNLDQAITLHQRKLDLLKETKKGFLQKMFV